MNRPRIIAFAIADSLRYDLTYPDIESTMSYLSGCSTHFHQVRSPACWTLPSHASMFGGLWPHEHGATTHTRRIRIDYPVLAEYLKKEGYYTLMITSNAVVTDLFGLNRGFDETRKVWREYESTGRKIFYSTLASAWRPRFRRKVIRSFIDRRIMRDIDSIQTMFRGYAPEILDLAKKRLQELLARGEKVFLFINFYDTHFPYLTTDQFRLETNGIKRIGELAQLQDIVSNRHMIRRNYRPNHEMLGHMRRRQRKAFRRLGRCFDGFARWLREVDDSSTIIFASDHGENFGEKRWLYHFSNVTEAGTHVPLLWSSGGADGRSDISTPVSLKHVFNSLLSEAGASNGADAWHLARSPERSLTTMQSYWYDANGKTLPSHKKNRMAFLSEDAKYIYQRNRWYREETDRDDQGQIELLSSEIDPIQEANLATELKQELRTVWTRFRGFEKTLPTS